MGGKNKQLLLIEVVCVRYRLGLIFVSTSSLNASDFVIFAMELEIFKYRFELETHRNLFKQRFSVSLCLMLAGLSSMSL